MGLARGHHGRSGVPVEEVETFELLQSSSLEVA